MCSIIGAFSQGSDINLKEVQVSEKALPEINILGENYSYRHRDVLIKKLLRLPFWSEDFVLKIDLSYFNGEVKNDFLLIISDKAIINLSISSLVLYIPKLALTIPIHGSTFHDKLLSIQSKLDISLK